jgi:uncharacterized protein YchJ
MSPASLTFEIVFEDSGTFAHCACPIYARSSASALTLGAVMRLGYTAFAVARSTFPGITVAAPGIGTRPDGNTIDALHTFSHL